MRLHGCDYHNIITSYLISIILVCNHGPSFKEAIYIISIAISTFRLNSQFSLTLSLGHLFADHKFLNLQTLMIVGSVMDCVVVFVLAKTLTIDIHVWQELL